MVSEEQDFAGEFAQTFAGLKLSEEITKWTSIKCISGDQLRILMGQLVLL